MWNNVFLVIPKEYKRWLKKPALKVSLLKPSLTIINQTKTVLKCAFNSKPITFFSPCALLFLEIVLGTACHDRIAATATANDPRDKLLTWLSLGYTTMNTSCQNCGIYQMVLKAMPIIGRSTQFLLPQKGTRHTLDTLCVSCRRHVDDAEHQKTWITRFKNSFYLKVITTLNTEKHIWCAICFIKDQSNERKHA